jgi:hypothetical protein
MTGHCRRGVESGWRRLQKLQERFVQQLFIHGFGCEGTVDLRQKAGLPWSLAHFPAKSGYNPAWIGDILQAVPIAIPPAEKSLSAFEEIPQPAEDRSLTAR